MVSGRWSCPSGTSFSLPQVVLRAPSGKTTLHPRLGYLPPLLWVSACPPPPPAPRVSVRHKLMAQSCNPVSFLAGELLWEGLCLKRLCVSVSTGCSCVPAPPPLTPICHGSFEDNASSPLPVPFSAALKISLCVCFSTVC